MAGYERILRAARSQVWAIQPDKLEAIMAFLEMRAGGGVSDHAVLEAIRADSAAAASRAASMTSAGRSGSIAVMPLLGLISKRANMVSQMSGPSGTSIEKFTAQFRQAANDSNVAAIVIPIDSPGGTVEGCPELSDEIFKARGKKRITAVSDCLCASAAYWIGCSATEFVVSPSSLTGSLGVYSAHEDDSAALEKAGVKVSLISAGKYKTEGSSYAPLSDDARGAMQDLVDNFYQDFVSAVARGRGVKASDVVNGFGQGRVLPARQAVAARMADRVGTFDSVLATYGVSSGGGSFRATAGGGLLSEQDSAMETLAILRQRAAEKKKREEIESRHANFGSSRDSGRGNF